jgi:nucleoside-diphosphate-sugar epimerase
MPMKVLVTGATGFIGQQLIRSLLADGYSVRALVRPSSNGLQLERMGAEIAYGDLLDPISIAQAVFGCRRVYHLAAQMLAPGVSKRRYFSVNEDGTRNLARACAGLNMDRIVFASSSGVYGIILNPPVDEETGTNPTSAYRESKWLAERSLHEELAGSGPPCVVARLSGIMGPGSMNWLGLSRSIAAGRFRIIGHGENHDNVAYVSDVVEGLRLCGTTPGIDGQVYLIGGKPSVTINQIVQTIARELGVETSKMHLPAAPYRAFNRLGEMVYKFLGVELPGVHRYALFLADKILDISKAERELGFQPKVKFAEGVRQTIGWYREKGLIQTAGPVRRKRP